MLILIWFRLESSCARCSVNAMSIAYCVARKPSSLYPGSDIGQTESDIVHNADLKHKSREIHNCDNDSDNDCNNGSAQPNVYLLCLFPLQKQAVIKKKTG